MLSTRLQRYIDGRPVVLRRSLIRYLRGGRPRALRWLARTSSPFWLLAPTWYVRSRADAGFLSDTLFAQFCLFLTIRMHDDLLDGQTQESWLILAGDDLFIEAQDRLARHISDPAFWSLFRRAIRKTLNGIANVDGLQRRPSGMPASARQLYADVASILSLGVGAVFARTGRLSEYPTFERLAADLAIASQLLDDIMDIEEDAARDRLNVAATVLIGSNRVASRCRRASVRRHVLARSVLDGRATAVIDLARTHLKRAARTAERMKLPQAVEYANRLLGQCDVMSKAVHHTRVDMLFAPLARRR